MNAISPIKLWYTKSGVNECPECSGYGHVWDGRGSGHSNDPDSDVVVCDNCDGRGFHDCEVCGYDVPHVGHDCLACDLVGELPATFEVLDEASLAKAFAQELTTWGKIGGAK